MTRIEPSQRGDSHYEDLQIRKSSTSEGSTKPLPPSKTTNEGQILPIDVEDEDDADIINQVMRTLIEGMKFTREAGIAIFERMKLKSEELRRIGDVRLQMKFEDSEHTYRARGFSPDEAKRLMEELGGKDRGFSEDMRMLSERINDEMTQMRPAGTQATEQTQREADFFGTMLQIIRGIAGRISR